MLSLVDTEGQSARPPHGVVVPIRLYYTDKYIMFISLKSGAVNMWLNEQGKMSDGAIWFYFFTSVASYGRGPRRQSF